MKKYDPGGNLSGQSRCRWNRPIVIVSRDELNRGRYVVAVPFTTSNYGRRRTLPNCVAFSTDEFGLSKDCVAQCEAILNIEISQLDPAPLGRVDDDAMRDIVRAIGFVIAGECEPE